jgi:ABC-type bacteriocin/lantibiotic exporter with double-glycine peptidase domain
MLEKQAVGSAASVRMLLSRASRSTRAWLGALVLLSVTGRLLLVVLATRLAGATTTSAVGVGVVSAIVFAAARAVHSFARVGMQRDVYAMTSRAVLSVDVLDVPTTDVRRLALDGTYHATLLGGQLAPALVADVIASVVLVPVLITSCSMRLLALAAAALLAVMLVTFALRSVTFRLERQVADASAAVFEMLLGSIESRLEIVARAGESERMASFERQLAAYQSLVRRAGVRTALLGRAPLAAGALAVLLVVSFDGGTWSGGAVTQALLLAACVPPLHGALLGAHGMIRSLVFVRPLVDLLVQAERTAEVPSGSHVVSLPLDVSGDGITFAYAPDARPVLRRVSFHWRAGEPLVLTGPNGSGKSTLFKLLLGLRPATAGSIRFGSHDLRDIDLRAFRQQVAYLPQRPYLGEAHVTVRAAMRLVVPEASDPAMREVLARTGVLGALREHSDDELAVPIGELSTGQRQRVALARVLLQDLAVLLLDEPDANLDRDGVELVGTLVRELASEGKMVAVIVHTPELAELSANTIHLGAEPARVVLRSVGNGP